MKTPRTDARALAEACGQLERRLQERTAELDGARAQLLELRAAAAAAGRAKAQFLANMSHELRTPMNGVRGMAELLNDTPLTGEQREYVDVLTSATCSLLRVVDDILDYSKLETGALVLEQAPFHLHRCIGDTLRALAPAARAKGLELVGYVDPALPETVTGDLPRLRQIVTALTTTAVTFTPAGEVTLELQRDDASPGDRPRVHGRVRCAGAGLADAERGAGLGLTISQRLVELMDGHLWEERLAGGGSSLHFTVCLDAPPGQPSLADVYRDRLFGAHALVAHGHAGTRQLVSRTLERCGMLAVPVEPRETLRTLRAREPRIDVVLLGIPSAGHELESLLEDIRTTSPASPVVLLAPPQETTRSNRLPIHAVVGTPVPVPALLAAVASALAPAFDAAPPRAARDRFRGLRVLVAEDNPINQRVITLMLEGWGATVTVAPSGRDTLAELERHDFDLVLMDVQMPHGDGFETTAAIRAREAGRRTRVPIVALTAQREDRARCLESGMDDYVAKPVVPAELADTLERVVTANGSHA